jgi:hypothetical protein
MQVPNYIQSFLQTPYSLSPEQIAHYQHYRYIKLKEVLNAETLDFFNKAITERVHLMNENTTPLNVTNGFVGLLLLKKRKQD